jgi:hypothetical protein
MTDILDLITRLEAASGPDRALDAEIAATLKISTANAPSWVINWKGLWAPAPKVNSGAVAIWNDGGELAVWWNAPRYTASLDAATTLLHPDHWWLLGKGRTRVDEPLCGVQIRAASLDEDIVIAEAEHPTSLVLAICSAALKVRTT